MYKQNSYSSKSSYNPSTMADAIGMAMQLRTMQPDQRSKAWPVMAQSLLKADPNLGNIFSAKDPAPTNEQLDAFLGPAVQASQERLQKSGGYTPTPAGGAPTSLAEAQRRTMMGGSEVPQVPQYQGQFRPNPAPAASGGPPTSGALEGLLRERAPRTATVTAQDMTPIEALGHKLLMDAQYTTNWANPTATDINRFNVAKGLLQMADQQYYSDLNNRRGLYRELSGDRNKLNLQSLADQGKLGYLQQEILGKRQLLNDQAQYARDAELLKERLAQERFSGLQGMSQEMQTLAAVDPNTFAKVLGQQLAGGGGVSPLDASRIELNQAKAGTELARQQQLLQGPASAGLPKEVAAASQTARKNLSNIDRYAELLQRYPELTGPGADAMERVRGAGAAIDNALGTNLTDKELLGAKQEMNALSGKFTLDGLAAFSGAISDSEREFTAKTVANTSNTVEANQALLDAYRNAELRKIEQAQFYDTYKSQSGSLQGAEAAWSKYQDAFPINSDKAISKYVEKFTSVNEGATMSDAMQTRINRFLGR